MLNSTGNIRLRLESIDPAFRLYTRYTGSFIQTLAPITIDLKIDSDGKISTADYQNFWSQIRGDDDYELLMLAGSSLKLLQGRNLNESSSFPLLIGKSKRYQVRLIRFTTIDPLTVAAHVVAQLTQFRIEHNVSFRYRSASAGEMAGSTDSTAFWDLLQSRIVNDYQGDQAEPAFDKFLKDLKKNVQSSLVFCQTHSFCESNHLWRDLEIVWTVMKVNQ